MLQYLDLCKKVLNNGNKRLDRTGIGTLSIFGYQMRFDLSMGFPIITTKQIYFRGIVHELLWFLSGDTNIRYLVKNNVNIWNAWPFQKYKESSYYKNETIAEFANKIISNEKFAEKWGELGPVYGKQWRNFGGIDQITKLIYDLKHNPYSRRHIVTAWNPPEIDKMALPPCHTFLQFYVSSDGKLSCQLYQRSADVFLGVPFNISSYALLTHLIALECDLKVGEFIHTLGDAHIYLNHINQIKTQIKRNPYKLPQILIKKQESIFDYKFEDIKLENYLHDAKILGKVAV